MRAIETVTLKALTDKMHQILASGNDPIVFNGCGQTGGVKWVHQKSVDLAFQNSGSILVPMPGRRPSKHNLMCVFAPGID